jgi:hypothetical protein
MDFTVGMQWELVVEFKVTRTLRAVAFEEVVMLGDETSLLALRWNYRTNAGMIR